MNPAAAAPAVGKTAGGTMRSHAVLEPPGGILVWMLVFLELVTFGAGLIVFVILRGQEPETFRRGQALLSAPLAALNTALLLTGGWLMANAMARLRDGAPASARRWVIASALSGVGFLAVKSCEYADKLRHGLDLHHDSFFTLYWLLTGFHYLHVLVAVVLLAAMARGLRRGEYTRECHENVEASGIFWHLCDLIWLLLLPVIYLLP